MKVRQVFALGLLTLATSAVFAAVPLENGEGSTRGFQGSAGPSQTTRAAVNVVNPTTTGPSTSQ